MLLIWVIHARNEIIYHYEFLFGSTTRLIVKITV